VVNVNSPYIYIVVRRSNLLRKWEVDGNSEKGFEIETGLLGGSESVHGSLFTSHFLLTVGCVGGGIGRWL